MVGSMSSILLLSILCFFFSCEQIFIECNKSFETLLRHVIPHTYVVDLESTNIRSDVNVTNKQ